MDVIAAIYDALTDEEVFAALPARLASEVGARSGIIQIFDKNGDLVDARCSYFERAHLEWYVTTEMYRFDVWKPPCSRSENLNRPLLLDDDVPMASFLSSTFFNENFRPWGDDTAHCLGGLFSSESGSWSLGLHRGRGSELFERDTLAAVERLVPHLRRLFDLRSRLGSAARQVELSKAALDRQRDAIFLLDGSSRPLLMNDRARALLEESGALVLGRTGLRAGRDVESRAFADAVATACARLNGQGAALRLSRPRGPALRVLISPVLIDQKTRALVVVNDTSRTDPNLVANLRSFYGLSTAEAEIATALAQGLAPSEVAACRGVSLSTVRAQIQHALRKADVRGIQELVALVSSAPRV